MNVIGRVKWKRLGPWLLTTILVAYGVASLHRASLVVDPRVQVQDAIPRRLHGSLWMWPPAAGLTVSRDTTVGELLPSVSIGQTFVAEYAGLSRVDVRLATYGRSNAGPLVFHLRTHPDTQEDLVTLTFDAANAVDNAYYTFEFPPIRDSAGRSFYFCLEAPEATPGNAITVWGSTEDVYPDGEAVLQGLAGNGVRDLTFRLGYDPPLWQRVGILAKRITANKPSVWGDVTLYVVLAVAYLVLLFLLFAQLLNAGAAEGKDRQYPRSANE